MVTVRIVQMRTEIHSRDFDIKITRKKIQVPTDLPEFEVDLEGDPQKCTTVIQCAICGKTLIGTTKRGLQDDREILGRWVHSYLYDIQQHKCAKKEDKKKNDTK